MLHYPKDRDEWLALRHKYVSSTEVSALFGMSPYATAFEIGILKQQAEPDPDREGSERMKWGIRMQHAIAKGVASEYGVKVRSISGYATHSLQHTRMGASFDYEIVGLADEAFDGDTILRDKYTTHGAGILEIKNVDSFMFKQWNTDDGIEPPPHIELQVQHQLACIARSWAAIGALVGGNRLELIVRDRDDDVCKALAVKCEKFWSDLAKGVLPPVDLPADAAMVAKLYRYAEPGKVLDAQGDDEVATLIADLCKQYAEAGAAEKSAKDAKEAAKARLLMTIGDAERVLSKGYTISAGVVAESEIPAYTRKGYRNVRVTAVKAKKEKVSEQG